LASTRKPWLDWERGLAVLFMVEVHVVDAWLMPAARVGPVHATLNMIGGFAAPGFLFMAGLSQVLADASQERRGIAPAERRRAALGRAFWLLGVAYLFRVGEYVLGAAFLNPDGWRDIFRVDILNVMAVALALSALVGVGRPARLHIALAVAACGAVALATPVVAGWAARWDGPAVMQPAIDYIYGKWPRANFSLFNWAAFTFAGSALGRWTLTRERPVTLVLLGIGLVAAGFAGDRLPPVYAHQDFWHTSPAWFAVRLGGIVVLTGLLQSLPESADRFLSWLRTLGRHSLLGYMASVELTFGLLTKRLHGKTSLGGVLVGIGVMTAVTWGLCIAADWWQGRRKSRI
jgi:uncharacterized membrane protein